MSSSEDEGIDVKRKRRGRSYGVTRAVDRDPLRIKKIVFDNSERLAVASFQSLGVPLPSKLSSVSSEIFSIKEGVLTPPEERKMKNILAMEIPLGNDENFRYEGSTPYQSEDMYGTWAAFVDEETGEATLYPADVFHMMPRSDGYGDHPWRLRMDIPTQISKDEADGEQVQEGSQPKKSAAKLRVKSQILSDSFGTTAKQRRKKQTGQNQLTSTAGSAKEMNTILTTTPVEKKIETEKKARIPGDEFGILPPMNLDNPATPRDVVDVDDLVPPKIAQLLLSVDDVVKIVERDEDQFSDWKKNNAFPSWFLNALKTLSHDEERRKRQATLFYSAYILYKLTITKGEMIRRKNANLPASWPGSVVFHYLLHYTQENVSTAQRQRKTRVMPGVLKDKAILHALFILLIAHDFSFAASEFFSELPGISESRIQAMCNLGRLSRFSRQGVTWIELKTPLPKFQIQKDGGGSRKRRN